MQSCNSLRCALYKCQRVATYSTDVEGVVGTFRKLELIPKKEEKKIEKKQKKFDPASLEVLPPRTSRMSVSQDWPSVWPTAQVFKPSVVPLPVRMGYQKKSWKNLPPKKFANLELMKIPNFLHLTPRAIKQHCDAIKKFCTTYPKELKGHEEKFFPLEFSYSDFSHSSPTVRDPRSRVVTLQVKLSNLTLDYHARDKLKRLVGHRYDPNTDLLTIVTDRCPARHQNKDYAMFLLTAVFHESWKVEAWEAEKTASDMEKYFWQNSPSQKRIVQLITHMRHMYGQAKNKVVPSDSDAALKKSRYLQTFPAFLERLPDKPTSEDILALKEVQEYSSALDSYRNKKPEDEAFLGQYSRCVRTMLGLHALKEPSVS